MDYVEELTGGAPHGLHMDLVIGFLSDVYRAILLLGIKGANLGCSYSSPQQKISTERFEPMPAP